MMAGQDRDAQGPVQRKAAGAPMLGREPRAESPDCQAAAGHRKPRAAAGEAAENGGLPDGPAPKSETNCCLAVRDVPVSPTDRSWSLLPILVPESMTPAPDRLTPGVTGAPTTSVGPATARAAPDCVGSRPARAWPEPPSGLSQRTPSRPCADLGRAWREDETPATSGAVVKTATETGFPLSVKREFQAQVWPRPPRSGSRIRAPSGRWRRSNNAADPSSWRAGIFRRVGENAIVRRSGPTPLTVLPEVWIFLGGSWTERGASENSTAGRRSWWFLPLRFCTAEQRKSSLPPKRQRAAKQARASPAQSPGDARRRLPKSASAHGWSRELTLSTMQIRLPGIPCQMNRGAACPDPRF